MASDSDFDPSWCIGFGGKIWNGGIQQWTDIDWNPAVNLVKGDRVGLLVSVGIGTLGQLMLFVNKKVKVVGPHNIPFDKGALYPLVDLMGNVVKLTFVRKAQPPVIDTFGRLPEEEMQRTLEYSNAPSAMSSVREEKLKT